jgi:hypothetical protein
VRLLAPLARDLAEWRMAQGRPNGDELLFPRPDGKPWTRDDWSNWRNRCFAPTIRELGVTGVRPYDLRHSFCSLLIQEGQSAVEVAAQAGHATTMTLNTYAHVFEELKGGARLDAEAQIKAAREAQVPVSYPKAVRPELSSQQTACKTKTGRSRTRTWDLFLIRSERMRAAEGRLRVSRAKSALRAQTTGVCGAGHGG